MRFEKALMLAKSMGEKIYERRATRGLAAAACEDLTNLPSSGNKLDSEYISSRRVTWPAIQIAQSFRSLMASS